MMRAAAVGVALAVTVLSAGVVGGESGSVDITGRILPYAVHLRAGAGESVSLKRTDGSERLYAWADAADYPDAQLSDIDVQRGRPLRYEFSVSDGRVYRFAMALCEGYWGQPGKRVQILRVEGADSQRVDTVADIGRNKVGVFCFDGRDVDGDGTIEISVAAADEAADKNSILNGLWVFAADVEVETEELLRGGLDELALTIAQSPEKAGKTALLTGDQALEKMVDLHKLGTDQIRRVLLEADQPPHFIPLPPGEVRPTGWIADWARAAAEGITGDLDESSAVFRDGWTGAPIASMNAHPEGTGWPLEQSAYYLDGLVRLAYVLQDERLVRKASYRLNMITAGVHADGSSLVYWRPLGDVEPEYKTDKGYWLGEFNNWAHSHAARAMLAFYQATGDKAILEALLAAYRNLPLPYFNLNVFYPVSGAVNLDPLLETYCLSGAQEILQRALDYAADERFAAIVGKWNKGDVGEGHGVIYYENIRVPALLYPWTGDPAMLKASIKALDSGLEESGLPIGLTSSEEYLAGIGSTRQTETCNVAVGPWTYLTLLRMSGDGSYADLMERTFFNAAPALLSRDYQQAAYYQAVNRIPGFPSGDQSRQDFHSTAGPVFCCIGNSTRVIPNFVMHMWMATMDGGLAALLYGPSHLQTLVADVPLVIETETSYPFRESIRMSVYPAEEIDFPLELRVPDWCRDPRIAINGELLSSSPDSRGFVRIERKWSPADTIEIEFPMTPRVVLGNETPFPPESAWYFNRGHFERRLAARKDIDEPFAWVDCGPLLFSLPIPDESPNQAQAGVKWNYALDSHPANTVNEIELIRTPMPARWDWPLDAPVKLRVPMKSFNWAPTEMQPLPDGPVDTRAERKMMVLVPYGSTKFRVSMFPLTTAAGDGAEHGD